MIHCVIGADVPHAGEVVCKALQRSFSKRQVACHRERWPEPDEAEILVLVGGPPDAAHYLRELGGRRVKVLILGALDAATARLAGIEVAPIDATLADAGRCAPALPHAQSQSRALIRYSHHPLGRRSPLSERRLCRFDFTDEWNNLGYGRTDCGDGPWSMAMTGTPRAAMTIAELEIAPSASTGAVATLNDTRTAAILWFARPVGPVDGADWSVIEAFLSEHRAGELPCRPYLRDVPHGFAAAVTMRLDCDEDIASAEPLVELYRARDCPLSLAIKTGQSWDSRTLDVLQSVRTASGAILSHSATHAADWGGSAGAAEKEARVSKAWLEARVPGLAVRYAVSPFHRNPGFVPAALAHAGYDGFIAGAIGNDPEYLVARGGEVPCAPPGFVSHSQSCMLHGDCLLADGDPISIYRQAFRLAQAGSQFFGYLDHPFSARYSYGWVSEQQRLAVHAEFLDFMRLECAAAGQPLAFVNEETCLDFMRDKAMTDIDFDSDSGNWRLSRTHAAGLPLSVAYRGRIEPPNG